MCGLNNLHGCYRISILIIERPIYFMEKLNLCDELIMGYRRLTQFNKLNQFPYRTEKEIKAYQLKEIKKILVDAYENVPFYHHLYKKAKIDVYSINSFSDFELVPTISKKDIIGNENAFLNRRYNVDELILSRTSGTSGDFLNIYTPHEMFITEELQVIRMIKEHYPQYTAFDSEVLVYTSEYPVSSILGFYRAYYINNLANPREIFQFIIDVRPTVLAIYPSILKEIVNEIEYEFSSLGLKLIILNSEQSTQAERNNYENMFKCTVIDEFSSEELQSIAYQCNNKEYHEVSDCTYVELLQTQSDKSVENNHLGEITGTCFMNHAMPFIRYRQGDYAYRKDKWDCKCGKHTKIIGDPQGRINDSFIAADGTIIPSGKLLDWSYSLVLKDNYMLNTIRIIQEDYQSVRIMISPELSIKERNGIIESFRSQFENKFYVEIAIIKEEDLLHERELKSIVSKVR